jgi:hypothetical protein
MQTPSQRVQRTPPPERGRWEGVLATSTGRGALGSCADRDAIVHRNHPSPVPPLSGEGARIADTWGPRL